MRSRPALRVFLCGVLAAVGLGALTASAQADVLVSNGSPARPFSQNKQNEPAVAIDQAPGRSNVVVAGANDERDMEPCNSGPDNTCPFTRGVGTSGVYFSFDGGQSWTQPTYTGLTARDCPDTAGPDAGCTAHSGLINTLPWYAENGLVSDGDPAVAFGPRPGPDGFRWSNGSRLYYANLTANVGATRSEQAFKGFEAIGVSRTDDPETAAMGGAVGKAAWMPPVLISHQSGTTFSDKEQIWADNAESSRFFGTVYACWAAFRGQEKGRALPAPLQVGVSHDGGNTWQTRQITAAANNGQRNPLDGCSIRTDSRGRAYVFGVGTLSSAGRQAFEFVSQSDDGGTSWSRPRAVAGPVTHPGELDPVQGSVVIDGVAGARADLAPAPSVDIANGAPTGARATNRIVLSYVSGTTADPHVFFAESTNRGASWTSPTPIETAGDRGFYAAPAISPSGRDVYVVYNAFTTPFQPSTATPRQLVGVVMHADTPGATGATGAFTEINRSVPGDPRGSSANVLDSEFLGDYVYAAATDQYGTVVWNDARNAADCGPIDAWRQALQAGESPPAPAPEQDCPANFGNSDIFGGSFPDPTP